MQGAQPHFLAFGIQKDQPGNHASGGDSHEEEVNPIINVQAEDATQKNAERIAQEKDGENHRVDRDVAAQRDGVSAQK